MAIITPLKITEDSTNASLNTCAAAGDSFTNTGIEFVRITNDHATDTYTVTITPSTTDYSFPRHGKLSKSNTSVSITAGNSAYMGPFKPHVWNTDGKVTVNYIVGTSGTTAISGTHLLKIEVLYLEQK